jgi:hypothetical protein
MAAQAKGISFEEFTEATLSSVMRAMEVRSPAQRKFPIGPIIFGIIWYPEMVTGSLGDVLQQGPISKETVRK